VPHPPGTPLLVLLGRVWTWALGLGGVSVAHAGALLAAVCTALVGGTAAAWLARRTGSVAAGVAGAWCAGGMSTVWASATEVEVYAAALLLAWGTFLAADASGRTADPSHAARLDALMAYGFALAVPLHLSALAAAPAVALLAATPRDGPLAWRRLAQHLAAAAACAGAGSGRRWLVLAGVAVAVGCAVGRRTAAARPAWRDGVRLLAALAVGLTPVLVMLARARHDPVLNQGDPSTWSALADVVARRQYAPAPPWPRRRRGGCSSATWSSGPTGRWRSASHPGRRRPGCAPR
jgi:hypothetical protein